MSTLMCWRKEAALERQQCYCDWRGNTPQDGKKVAEVHGQDTIYHHETKYHQIDLNLHLHRMADLEVWVKSHNVEVSFVEDVPSYVSLETVLVNVFGVPPLAAAFSWTLGCWVGHRSHSRRRSLCLASSWYCSHSGCGALHGYFLLWRYIGRESTLAEAFVKMDGYCFCYQVEKKYYIPDANFTPIVWKHHDDSPDTWCRRKGWWC